MIIYTVTSYATLGDEVKTINVDNKDLTDTQTTVTTVNDNNATYLIYDTKVKNKFEVKQYVSNNKVFAIVWQGIMLPDLSKLLGNYYIQYQTVSPKYKSSTLQSIEDQDFISYFGSSNKYFYGKAIIPSLMPQDLVMIKIK
ncbi:MAG: DUF2844 domain-containing protein [Burkholderiales bacterium]|nr:DUF2844 domain-containing protein [Burkholderiales bacterium]